MLAVISDLINQENKRLYFKEFCFVLGYYQMISELDRLIINSVFTLGFMDPCFLKLGLESIQNLSQNYAICSDRFVHGLFIL